jgi:hypothetical protein
MVFYRFQTLYVRLTPESAEILKAIRGLHHNKFPYPVTPIAFIYNIVYCKSNINIIPKVLDNICSTYGAASFRLICPFENMLHTGPGVRKTVSVYYNIERQRLLPIKRKCIQKLGGIETIERQALSGTSIPQLGLLRDNLLPQFDSLKVPIRHQIPIGDSSRLVHELTQTTPILTAVGLSLDPGISNNWLNENRTDLQSPPWMHFTFSGSK